MPRSRKSSPRFRRSSPRTCWMRPTRIPSSSRTKTRTRGNSGRRAAGGARGGAKKDGKEAAGSSRCTMPSYLPVMQYADDRALRETLYRASATRASEFGKPEWNNTPLIATHRAAARARWRSCSATQDFAEVSLVPKMARVAEPGARVPRDLAKRARPFAERDVAELREPSRAASWGSRSSNPGTSPTPRKSCAPSAMRSPTRR